MDDILIKNGSIHSGVCEVSLEKTPKGSTGCTNNKQCPRRKLCISVMAAKPNF